MNVKAIRTYLTYLLLGLHFLLNAQSLNLLPDTVNLCSGDSANLEVKLAQNNFSSITWNTPYRIITNTKKITVSLPGKYYVKLFSPQYTSAVNDSVFVKQIQKPKKTLIDTFICRGKTVLLDAKNAGMRYYWNTGEVNSKIRVENPGTYVVKISNAACYIYDTVQVKLNSKSQIALSAETTFCLSEENKQISVKANPGTKILWSTGSTLNTTTVSKEGYYWVKTEAPGCDAQLDSIHVKLKVCDCEMIIPNSFTPNEDNRNDFFFPVLQCDYTYYLFSITDRWGNAIFSTYNTNAKWDGRFKGNLCAEDIYFYRIESIEKGNDKKVVRSGRISLFR